MLTNIISVATQVIILFIIIAVGFVLTKAKVLNKERVSGLIDIVVYLVTPSNLIVSFQREFKSELLAQLGLSFLLAFIIFGLNCVMAKLVIHDKNEDRNPVLRFASAFPNAGYMALPLQRAILGDIGVFYGAAFIGIFHCYVWTYGVKLLSPVKEKAKLKKIIFNPPIIGIAIGLVLFLTQIKLPEIVVSPLSYFSALNTPVPMLIIGYYLANTDLKATFSNAWVYLGALLRLIVSPLMALGFCFILNAESDVAVACIIACSAPTAALSGMLAMKYGRDTQVSVGMISLTTILSIITMPVLIALARILT
ncbi:MAG: AEC family transporter [Lachnospiraceae bacterium]|nr:AEC family transporter [Lachnospiraceae bacterium]